MDRIALSPPAPVRALVRAVLDTRDAGWTPADGEKDEIADFVADMIAVKKGEMLACYFGLAFDAESKALTSVPELIDNYVPPMALLPMFLLRLAIEVDWTDEERYGQVFFVAAHPRSCCVFCCGLPIACQSSCGGPPSRWAGPTRRGRGQSSCCGSRVYLLWLANAFAVPAIETDWTDEERWGTPSRARSVKTLPRALKRRPKALWDALPCLDERPCLG